MAEQKRVWHQTKSDVNWPTKQKIAKYEKAKDVIMPSFVPDKEKMEAVLAARKQRELGKEFAMKKSRNFLDKWRKEQNERSRPKEQKEPKATKRSPKPIVSSGHVLPTASFSHFETIAQQENKKKAEALRAKFEELMSKKK